MKRPIALLSLSLALVSSAFADERGFARALKEWQALYRPLTTARGPALADAILTIERMHNAYDEAVSRASEDPAVKCVLERKEVVARANATAIRMGYSRANVREKRAFVRLAAILGNRFGEGDTPWYPTCGNGPYELKEVANGFVYTWVEENPAAYLGLLDDPDARVAEAAVRLLHERYPDEVILRLKRWQKQPNAKFRGAAVKWSWLLGEEVNRNLLLRYLDDPSDSIRDFAVAELPYSDVQKVFRLRRPKFEKATWPQRRTILTLASRVDAPDLLALAVACLEASDTSLLQAAFETLHYTLNEVAAVPSSTLARLRKHSDWSVRMEAYHQSGRQHVPMRELRAGLADNSLGIRLNALTASCQGVETEAEFRFLLDYGLKNDATSSLPDAAHRMGVKVVDLVLPFLASSDAQQRRLGVKMASGIPSPRLEAALEKVLRDPSSDVKETLASEIAFMPEVRARRWLQVLAADADETVRKAAESALEIVDARVADLGERA